MHRSKLAFVAACLSLSLPRIAAAEDLTIISQIVLPTVPVSRSSTLWISDTMVRHADRNQDQIYEVATGRMIEIDHPKKEYWETTPEQRERELQSFGAAVAHMKVPDLKADARAAQLDAMIKKAREHRAALKEELRKLPQEQQKALGEFAAELEEKVEGFAKAEKQFLDDLDKRPPLPVKIVTEVRIGTGRRQIVGFECEQHFIASIGTFADGSDHMVQEVEQWIAPDLELPASVKAVKDGMLPLMMGKSVGKLSPGMPLASIVRREGGVDFDVSAEAVEIKKGPIDPTVFAAPTGYTKVQSPLARAAEEYNTRTDP